MYGLLLANVLPKQMHSQKRRHVLYAQEVLPNVAI